MCVLWCVLRCMCMCVLCCGLCVLFAMLQHEQHLQPVSAGCDSLWLRFVCPQLSCSKHVCLLVWCCSVMLEVQSNLSRWRAAAFACCRVWCCRCCTARRAPQLGGQAAWVATCQKGWVVLWSAGVTIVRRGGRWRCDHTPTTHPCGHAPSVPSTPTPPAASTLRRSSLTRRTSSRGPPAQRARPRWP